MRSVTLKELTDWVEKNKHRTWIFLGKGDPRDLTLEIKYLEFSLDTRDMTVWSITTSGMGNSINISIRDGDGPGTILDALEAKLEEAKRNGE